MTDDGCRNYRTRIAPSPTLKSGAITRRNPEHDAGKHQARIFLSALGFTQADAATLREMV